MQMKKQHVTLSEQDRLSIEELLSKGSLNIRSTKRALGLQMLNSGLTYLKVSEHLGVNNLTVSKWANKYRTTGLSFLTDKSRSGRPTRLSGKDLAKVTALACSKPPAGYSRWSVRLLADYLVELEYIDAISHTKVADILKKTNCSLIERNNGV